MKRKLGISVALLSSLLGSACATDSWLAGRRLSDSLVGTWGRALADSTQADGWSAENVRLASDGTFTTTKYSLAPLSRRESLDRFLPHGSTFETYGWETPRDKKLVPTDSVLGFWTVRHLSQGWSLCLLSRGAPAPECRTAEVVSMRDPSVGPDVERSKLLLGSVSFVKLVTARPDTAY